MKKTKSIALALVIALIVIGVGYAGWTEKFTSTNNIATGNLKIAYEEEAVKHSANIYNNSTNTWHEIYQDEDNDYNVNMNYQYIESLDTDDPGSVNFNVEKIVPGTVYWSKFKLRNVGSIPAALKNVVANVTSNNQTLKEKTRITIKSYISNSLYYLSEYETLNDLDAKTITPTILRKLNKNDYMTFYIRFNLEEVDFNGDECENSNLSLTLDYNFMQANIWTKPN